VPDESRRTALDSEAAQRELTRVAEDVLPAIIARFGAASLGELEIRHGEWRVRLRRADGAAPSAGETSGATHAAGVSGAGRPRESRDRRSGDAARRSEGDGAHADRSMVTSPAVGYFQPAEGLEVGRSFRTGDVLGHVDVLGIRHDVVTPADGVLGRILVESAEAVEYGQEIARVDRPTARPGPS